MNESNELTLDSNLPLFTGYYQSIFCQYDSWYDSEYEYLTTQEDMSESDASDKLDNCDLESAHLEASKNLVKTFEKIWNETFPTHIEVKYISLDKPREYNFHNDKIRVSVRFNKNGMKTLIDKNNDSIAKFIAKTFKRVDGFIPFYEDDFKKWDFENLEDFDHNEIWTIFSALCESKNLDQESLLHESNIYEEFMNNVRYPDNK